MLWLCAIPNHITFANESYWLSGGQFSGRVRSRWGSVGSIPSVTEMGQEKEVPAVNPCFTLGTNP